MSQLRQLAGLGQIDLRLPGTNRALVHANLGRKLLLCQAHSLPQFTNPHHLHDFTSQNISKANNTVIINQETEFVKGLFANFICFPDILLQNRILGFMIYARG